MGKGGFGFIGHAQGRCRGCRAWFVGPGDRCPPCAKAVKAKAVNRKRRKRR